MEEKRKNKGNVPNLRFPGFEGEWKIKKVGELCDSIVPGRNKPTNFNGNIPWITTPDVEHDGVVSFSKKGLSISEEEAKKIGSKIVPARSIIISCVGELGLTAIAGNDLVINQQLHAFLPKKIHHQFLLYCLGNQKKYMERVATKTALPYMNKENCNSIPIRFPSFNEQIKVGQFLKTITERIQTQSKIIKELTTSITSLKEKLFTEKIKLRNKDDDFPKWEMKTFREVSDVKRGASPRPISSPIWFAKGSGVGWVRISDVTKSTKYLVKTEQYLSKEGIAKSRLVKQGNIIMSICATIGKPIYTNFNVCIHDGFVVFENLSLDKEYLYYYLDYIQSSWYRYGQPGTQVNLNSDIVNNEIIPVPSLEEQQAIAKVLAVVDEKIKLENTLLEFYNKQKKYLLSNLFI